VSFHWCCLSGVLSSSSAHSHNSDPVNLFIPCFPTTPHVPGAFFPRLHLANVVTSQLRDFFFSQSPRCPASRLSTLLSIECLACEGMNRFLSFYHYNPSEPRRSPISTCCRVVLVSTRDGRVNPRPSTNKHPLRRPYGSSSSPFWCHWTVPAVLLVFSPPVSFFFCSTCPLSIARSVGAPNFF